MTFIPLQSSISEPQLGYLMRVYSTCALTRLWEFRQSFSDQITWLGMLEFPEARRFASLQPAERLERIDARVSICSNLSSEERPALLLPWMGARFVTANRGLVPEEMPPFVTKLNDALRRDGNTDGDDEIRMAVLLYDPDYTTADLIDALYLSFTEEKTQRLWSVAARQEDFLPLKVATSFSQSYLINLVARNRQESVSSVLREAIALLLDSEG